MYRFLVSTIVISSCVLGLFAAGKRFSFDLLKVIEAGSSIIPRAVEKRNNSDPNAPSALPTELFFSEYVEGTSSNRAIEIYNGTGASVSLVGYSLELYSDGRTEPNQTIGNLSGTIQSGGVWVITHSQSVTALRTKGNQTNATVLGFTGNDAVVLRKNGAIVDVIGQIGDAPLIEWGTGDVTTANHTLVRKSTVCGGDTNPSDAFDPATEWIGYPIDTFDYVGSHTANCVAPPDLSIDDVVQSEGNAGTTDYTFTVSLSTPAPAGGVSFDIATSDDTAQDGTPIGEDEDYVGASLTNQTIPQGASTYQFSVSVNGDAEVESNENFFVNVTNIVGATAADTQGTATITNDDAAPIIPGTISFSSARYSGAEGGSSIVVTATRSGGSDGAVGVTFTASDSEATGGASCTPGIDYVRPPGTLNWADGDTVDKTFSITLCDDADYEPNEDLTTTLSVPTGGAFLGTMASATVRIENDDADSLAKSMWVFGDSLVPNPVSDPTGRSRLRSSAALNGVTEMYVSVYRSTLSTSGRRMYEDADMAALIESAHGSGIEVWAAYGAPDWPTFGCGAGDFPVQRMAEVAAYNASQSAERRFDGVMLDVESGPVSEAEFQALIAHFECMRSSLPATIKLGVAINAFWDDDLITYSPVGGVIKPASQHIVDLDLDRVVVMGYRDIAGTDTCPTSDGIICLDKAEIDYATSIGKPSVVLAGLETIDPTSVGILDKETFFEEGSISLNAESAAVSSYFAASVGFGGFAIHNYSAAYLSGDTGWPTGPSAAPISISGRVLGPTGRPIRGAFVTITDAFGIRATAVTNSFGHYRFEDLRSGESYTLSAEARRYTFSSQMITADADIAGFDIHSDQ